MQQHAYQPGLNAFHRATVAIQVQTLMVAQIHLIPVILVTIEFGERGGQINYWQGRPEVIMGTGSMATINIISTEGKVIYQCDIGDEDSMSAIVGVITETEMLNLTVN